MEYPKIEDQIENWFTYHAPDPEDVVKYNAIREAGKAFALVLAEHCPGSADLTVAVRRVREAVMCANASIACGGK